MKEEYYESFFKRKSFHLFRNVGSDKISAEKQKNQYIVGKIVVQLLNDFNRKNHSIYYIA